jgi:hypothetical protein
LCSHLNPPVNICPAPSRSAGPNCLDGVPRTETRLIACINREILVERDTLGQCSVLVPDCPKGHKTNVAHLFRGEAFRTCLGRCWGAPRVGSGPVWGPVSSPGAPRSLLNTAHVSGVPAPRVKRIEKLKVAIWGNAAVAVRKIAKRIKIRRKTNSGLRGTTRTIRTRRALETQSFVVSYRLPSRRRAIQWAAKLDR